MKRLISFKMFESKFPPDTSESKLLSVEDVLTVKDIADEMGDDNIRYSLVLSIRKDKKDAFSWVSYGFIDHWGGIGSIDISSIMVDCNLRKGPTDVIKDTINRLISFCDNNNLSYNVWVSPSSESSKGRCCIMGEYKERDVQDMFDYSRLEIFISGS